MQGSQIVFLDGYMYWFSIGRTDATMHSRMFNSLDTATGSIRNTVVLEGIAGQMHDDGWLTTDGSRLYITAYGVGLFDSEEGSKTSNSKVAYATINNGKFSDIGYIDLGKPTAATSQFLVFNDRAYVTAGTTFYVFDVVGSTFKEAYQYNVNNRTHGGVAMDVSHVDADGTVYIYMLPYSPSGGDSLIIFSDKPGQKEGIAKGYPELVPDQFGSQAVRAGPNGELLWYNDRALVYSVSVKQDSGKDYSIFINEGETGKWITTSGEDLIGALETLEEYGVTLDNEGNPMYDDLRNNLYFWSDKNSRWEISIKNGIDNIRALTYVISQTRPSATDIWCYTESGVTEGYTIKEMASAAIPSGTVFTKMETEKNGVVIEDITISHDVLYMMKNDRDGLSASVTTSTGNYSKIVWSSSNTTIVTVDQEGNIKAVGKGMAYVMVYSHVDPTASARCYINVSEISSEVEVRGLTLDKGLMYMNVEDNGMINPIFEPSNVTDQRVTFVSSDPTIVEVDSEGNLTAMGIGTVTITATSLYNPFFTAECIVNVISYQTGVTSISLNKTEVLLDVGGIDTLIANVLPGNASNKNVVWSSSNNSIVMVDSNGNLAAMSNGTAVIYAKTVDGERTAFCLVTVGGGSGETPTGTLYLDQTSLSLTTGGVVRLTAALSSGEIGNRLITWTSNNTMVATVDMNGSVTAISDGTAVITASLISENRTPITTAICVVTVGKGTSGGSTEEDTVQTEIVNGVNGHIAEIHVKASMSGTNARISSDNIDTILQHIARAKESTRNNSLPSMISVDLGSARTLTVLSPASIAAAGAGLKIFSSNGTVDIPNSVLKSMTSGKVVDLTININTVDWNELLKDHRDVVSHNDVIFEVTAHVGNSSLHQLGGKVTVSLPFEIQDGVNINDVHAWHLKDDGTIDELEFTYKNGCIVLVMDHFSHFALGHPADSKAGSGIDSTTILILMAIVIIALGIALAFIIGRSFGARSEKQ